MKEWVASEWASVFKNPHCASSTGKTLVADVYAAQQTDAVKAALRIIIRLNWSMFRQAAQVELSP